MLRMLGVRGLLPVDLQGLPPQAAALLTAMQQRLEQQASDLAARDAQVALQLALIQHKDREIVRRDAKLEKVTFELARLKRWKFGARTEAMSAEQRRLFDETLAEDEASLQAQLDRLRAEAAEAASACPKPKTAPRRPRREALPAHLRRVEHRHEPEDTSCCTPTRRRSRCSTRARARRARPTSGRTPEPPRSDAGRGLRLLPRARGAVPAGLLRWRRAKGRTSVGRHAPDRPLRCYDTVLDTRVFPDRCAAACVAHARRKSDELAKHTASPLAAEATRRFARIYELESRLGDLSDGKRQAKRQDLAKPLWEKLKAWLELERRRVVDGGTTAGAIDYTLGHWTALTRHLDDGAVAIYNNHLERQIKPWAMGRKAWMFVGSELAGQRGAIVMSLVQSARLNGHDPWA